MRRTVAFVLCFVGVFAERAYAYGPRGHSLVGAIADRLVATNAPDIHAKIAGLLDGISLEEAAVIPDQIKTWDSSPAGFQLAGHPEIEAALRAFVAANPAGGHPSHHEFHYTDVPVTGGQSYASGQVGRSEYDLVHMISFCVRVLNGAEPESNPRKITKPVALILLAHYLGDIHQPLHVGAEYFNADKVPFEPISADGAYADEGGNKLTLYVRVAGNPASAGKFHKYWDGQTVENAFGAVATVTTAKKLAKSEPEAWKLNGASTTWAEQMADEILPTAREAHSRLAYKRIRLDHATNEVAGGRAEEKPTTGGPFYAKWAAATALAEIHKAGWRLAAILEATLPTRGPSANPEP